MGVERVRRANDASSSRIQQDVCVDHGGLHILVAEVIMEADAVGIGEVGEDAVEVVSL